jgi:predicted SAM-dependent methyltransferase
MFGYMKLHLGCGKKYLPTYTHIDAQKYDNVDIVADMSHLPYPDQSVDEIYICHALEHFPRRQIWDILQEFHRVLIIGGSLRISVPDLESCMKHYEQTQDLGAIMGLLYGGQRNQYDYHFFGFDFKLMSQILSELGFSGVQRYDASQFLPPGFDDYSLCYIPHMDKENGRLMSLNVIGTKTKSYVALPSTELKKIFKLD